MLTLKMVKGLYQLAIVDPFVDLKLRAHVASNLSLFLKKNKKDLESAKFVVDFHPLYRLIERTLFPPCRLPATTAETYSLVIY